MTRLTPVLVLLVSTSLVRAGFRCTLGNWACSASCVTLGQTSGICDGEGECNCSERSIRSVVSLTLLHSYPMWCWRQLSYVTMTHKVFPYKSRKGTLGALICVIRGIRELARANLRRWT